MKEEIAGEVAEAVGHCSAQVNFISKHFCEGGIAMYFIAGIGIMALFLIIERFLSLRSLSISRESINSGVFSAILSGNLKSAIAFCDTNPRPLTNTLKAGLIQVLNKRPDEEVQVAMDASVLREIPRVEGWSSFLAVLGNMAVLVGLVGTVIGLIISFGGIAVADNSMKAILLSQGISEALNCTAFGLMVAIIAILFHGFFTIRISKETSLILEKSMEIMNLVTSNRDKLKNTMS
ncbi:MAG: MotA/TolQ/ExbB proton channel family protein [Bdellovibrionales bacterium]|nr:MotA/TolQ/ExbB proton channel family protein [Bdellovibrionales bacterium]